MTTDGFAVLLLAMSLVILVIGLLLIRVAYRRQHEHEGRMAAEVIEREEDGMGTEGKWHNV